MKEYLVILRQSPEFQKFLDHVYEERPIIPLHTYSPDNTEQWKAMSGEQRGFDLLFSFLSGR